MTMRSNISPMCRCKIITFFSLQISVVSMGDILQANGASYPKAIRLQEILLILEENFSCLSLIQLRRYGETDDI